MTSMLNQVFLSYRHETGEHARAVKRLGELLRQAKLPVALDQFFLDEHPGGPDEGWPKWCEDCANQSTCVLVIASPGWFAAYEGTGETGSGCGAAVEAALFRQFLYDEKGINPRIRLAFLGPLPAACATPERLRAWHQFRPFDSGQELDQLVRWVADRLGLAGIEPPTVRWPEPVPFEPDLADRTKEEWPAVVELLAGRSRQRILLFEGASGHGKSELLRQSAKYAKEKLGIPVVFVNFKGGTLDVAGVLGQFELELGGRLPNFSREGASKPHLLRKDLRALRSPTLLILDTYEDASSNQAVADWLNLQLLAEVETSLGLAVILAGQKVPDIASSGWRDLARHLPLGPIREPEHWGPLVERRFPGFRNKGAHLPTVLLVADGNPAVVCATCKAIAERKP